MSLFVKRGQKLLFYKCSLLLITDEGMGVGDVLKC